MGLHGPSTILEVPSLEEDEEGVEEPTSETLSVLVIDVANAAAAHMTLYDPADGVSVVPFDPVQPQRFPEVSRLLALTRAWLRSQGDDRMAFYSAVEDAEAGVPEEEAPEPAPPFQAGPKRAAAKAKRVTTNQLATQIDQLLSAMPRLTDQLQQLGARQQALSGRRSKTKARAPDAVLPPQEPARRRICLCLCKLLVGPSCKDGTGESLSRKAIPGRCRSAPGGPEETDGFQAPGLQGALL